MRGRHALWPAAVVAAFTLLTPACSGSGSQAGSQGGILRIGTSYPIDSLNPFVGQSDYTYMAFEYIYPALVQYNQPAAGPSHPTA